jgi:hypothetical protein
LKIREYWILLMGKVIEVTTCQKKQKFRISGFSKWSFQKCHVVEPKKKKSVQIFHLSEEGKRPSNNFV